MGMYVIAPAAICKELHSTCCYTNKEIRQPCVLLDHAHHSTRGGILLVGLEAWRWWWAGWLLDLHKSCSLLGIEALDNDVHSDRSGTDPNRLPQALNIDYRQPLT
jgi:hypothetical protein